MIYFRQNKKVKYNLFKPGEIHNDQTSFSGYSSLYNNKSVEPYPKTYLHNKINNKRNETNKAEKLLINLDM